MIILNEQRLVEAPIRMDFKKAGFTRNSSMDFTDDGNRFYGYIHRSGMPMTYNRYQDDVYIALRPDYLKDLTYSEYSKLPHYKDADKYNGVLATDVDYSELDSIATDLMKEYEDMVNEISTKDYSAEWEDYKKAYWDFYGSLYKECKDLVTNNIERLMDLSSGNVSNIFEYLKKLKGFANRDLDKTFSDDMDKRYAMQKGLDKTSFYADQIKKVLGA